MYVGDLEWYMYCMFVVGVIDVDGVVWVECVDVGE